MTETTPSGTWVPCHRCGEPAVQTLVGTPADVIANPLIEVWCTACALIAEAERATAWGAVKDQLEADDA